MVLAHNIQFGHRTQDVKISEDVTFETMLLSDRTLNGLKNSGFYKPSPIQLHGIPLGKCGFDLLLEAKSGTGKTAVFTIITLEKLDLNKGLQAIVLAPTREIAAQICDVIKQIGSAHEGLNVEVVMGGLSVKDDIEKFKKQVHVVVGSPGRLKHLIHDNYIDTSSVRLLVIDECDKLMEKCFLPDVNYIFSILPIQKQVIMSSATYPENCKTFIGKYVHNAQHICPDSNSILLGIAQHVTTVQYNNNIVRQTQYKFQELLKILSKHQYKQCLIFCNYQARVSDIYKWLKREKWPVEQLHGQQDQTHRLDALKTLQDYKCRILISTDLAARGIDASNVDLVINFEPPFEWQTYLHRIGRAGRFGSYGIAVTILSEGNEVNNFKGTLRTMKIPLILRNLWTVDEFENESLDYDTTQHPKDTTQLSKVEEKEKHDEHFKDLWNLLIKEEDKNAESLHSFEVLHKSYQDKNETETETFSDLLQSFEQNEQEVSYNNEDISYKNIVLKEFPAKKYFNDIQKENFNLGLGTQLHDNVSIGLENSITINNFYQNKKTMDDNFTKEKFYLNSKNNTVLLSGNEVVKNYSNNSKYIKSDEDDFQIGNCDIKYNHKTNVTEVLTEMDNGSLDADLSSSFGGMKYKKSISKFKNNKCNMLLDNCFLNDNISDIERDKYRKSDICRTREISSTKGNSKNCYNSNKKKSSQRAYHTYKDTKKDPCSSLNISEGHVSNTQMEHDRHEHHLNYNLWYNKFKTHMKYVENTLYIKEICKL